MRAGLLRHKLIIERPVDARGELGEALIEWHPYPAVWGSVEPLSGRELMRYDRTMGELSHRITIRYLPALTTKMRIRFGERLFGITSIINKEERNISLEIMCQEKV